MLPLLQRACLPARGSAAAAAAARSARLASSTPQEQQQQRPPLPPFDDASARQKVQAAEDAWNTRDPERVALAYTPDCEWRNRAEFVKGRGAIREFLARKWARELDYRLKKTLFAHQGNRIAVCFEYEYRDASGQWYRAYGNENWVFNSDGLMAKRIASINEAPIEPGERRIAVDAPRGGPPPANPWLAQDEGGGVEFPLGGGHAAAY